MPSENLQPGHLEEVNENFEFIDIDQIDDIERVKEVAKYFKEEATKARKEAATDTLTGMWKEGVFMRQLDAQLGRLHRPLVGNRESDAKLEEEDTFVLLYLDLDNFKPANDLFGHPFGDKVIKAVAKVIKTHTRKTDFQAILPTKSEPVFDVRFHGDEFGIIFLQTNAEKIRVKVEGEILPLIREEMKKLLQAEKEKNSDLKDVDLTHIATASIGIVQAKAGLSAEELIKRADDAMYYSKEKGKNKATVFDEIPEGWTRKGTTSPEKRS